MRSFSLLLLLILAPLIQAGDDRPLPVRVRVRILGLTDSVELPLKQPLTGDDVTRLAVGDNLRWSRLMEVVTLNGSEAQLQMGESNNVITGIVSSRTSGSVGGRGPASSQDEQARRAAMLLAMQGRAGRSTTTVLTGTLVQVTPRIVDNGVVLELTIESSRLAPAGEDDSGVPTRETQTITAQSTVLVSDGQPAVMRATVQSGNTTTSGHVLIVVDAEAAKAPE